MLAFVSAANLLLTSRAVEHFRGRHKTPKRSDADAEMGAYGIANLAVGIFGAPMSIGIPARSVAAVRCGATTRLTNIMHGVFLFLLVSMGSGALAHIPMAALAASRPGWDCRFWTSAPGGVCRRCASWMPERSGDCGGRAGCQRRRRCARRLFAVRHSIRIPEISEDAGTNRRRARRCSLKERCPLKDPFEIQGA